MHVIHPAHGHPIHHMAPFHNIQHLALVINLTHVREFSLFSENYPETQQTFQQQNPNSTGHGDRRGTVC